jgi:hypothetical protein
MTLRGRTIKQQRLSSRFNIKKALALGVMMSSVHHPPKRKNLPLFS